MKTNYLHQGDCLPFLESLPDNTVDALITDPPYASGGSQAASRQQATIKKYRISHSKSIGLKIRVNDCWGKDNRSYGLLCIGAKFGMDGFRFELKNHFFKAGSFKTNSIS